jgi:hypothetical protein
MAISVANGGTTLSLGATPTLIGEITSINVSGFGLSAVESTNLAATTKTFLPGIISPGTISCDFNSDGANAGQDLIKSTVTARTSIAFAIASADGSSFSGSCIITGYDYKAAVDGVITGSVSLQVTGTLTIT